jgi:hypothetical protein
MRTGRLGMCSDVLSALDAIVFANWPGDTNRCRYRRARPSNATVGRMNSRLLRVGSD